MTVVCCGNKGRIDPPESSDWIEVGWTDDTYSYVNASDLFILPNRETYFDLALLETMSLGRSALISRTGGNKIFEGMEDRGIYTFGSEDEAVRAVQFIKNEDPAVKREKEAAMKVLFEQEYSMEKFYGSYKKLLSRIGKA